MEKLQILQEFQHNLNESLQDACMSMKWLITMTQGVTKNIICPILVWDFGQGALTLSVGCYVTIVHTTQIVKCVLVVGMHQNEHGEGMCDDFWV